MLNNLKNSDVIITILVVIALAGVIMGANAQLTIFKEEVRKGFYTSTKCVERTDSMRWSDYKPVSDNGEFLSCKSSDLGAWMPLDMGLQCEFEPESPFASYYNIYRCPGDVESYSEVETRCTDELDHVSTYTIDVGDKLYVNPNTLLDGSMKVRNKHPSYGLQVFYADGRISSVTNNCLLTSMGNFEQDTELAERTDNRAVKPGHPLNTVTLSTTVRSSNLITVDRIEGGDPIYVLRPHYYRTVEETEEGTLFVDTKEEHKDESLECLPSNQLCNADARWKDEDSPERCEDLGGGVTAGAVTDYQQVPENPYKMCKWRCEGGESKMTDDCKIVDADCDEGEQWSWQNYKCVDSAIAPPEKQGFDAGFWVLLGSLVVLLAVAYKKFWKKKD